MCTRATAACADVARNPSTRAGEGPGGVWVPHPVVRAQGSQHNGVSCICRGADFVST